MLLLCRHATRCLLFHRTRSGPREARQGIATIRHADQRTQFQLPTDPGLNLCTGLRVSDRRIPRAISLTLENGGEPRRIQHGISRSTGKPHSTPRGTA